MGWLLYQAGMLTLLTVAAPVFLLRRGGHYLPTLRGRLALGPAPPPRPRLWIHAVSVGEVGVAATLARSLPPSIPLLVTTVTPTGQAVARRAFAGADVAYLPFDLGLPVRRFLDAHTPTSLVLAEGDLWPLLLDRVKRRSLPVVVINGRISDRGFARLRRVRRWVGPLFAPVDAFGVQTERDRERLLELGVRDDRITVTGNLKFDTPEPAPLVELEVAVRALAAGRPVLVAGSTMEGEEPAVLDAFLAAGPERALLVLAPRHPERCDQVAEATRGRGLELVRRSRMAVGGRTRPAVLVLDTMGELASLYRIASAAFVGGTLVPTGGHNPLEPARFGRPIVAGPSMENFAEMAALFDRRGAWRRVASGEELGAAWREWLDHPERAAATGERAAALLAESRGALQRTLEILRPLLSGAEP